MKQVNKDQRETETLKNKVIEDIKLVKRFNIKNSVQKPVKESIKESVKKDTLWTRLKKVIGH